jgi:flagellar biosynthesis/type III secretory pathway M-ring protein FliF/YscJ
VQKAVSDYSSLVRPISLLGLFLMAYLFVLRPIQREALKPGQSRVAEQAVLAAPAKVENFSLGPEVSDATLRAGQLKDEAIELVKQKPADTTRAVQAWLREEAL